MLSHKNRKSNFIGAIYAAIVLSKSDSLTSVNKILDDIRAEEAILRREVQCYNEAKNKALDTLRTRDLALETYARAIREMQNYADTIYEYNRNLK